MDTSQWPQDHILLRPMEEIVPKPSSVERKIRPLKELANCPRCNSTNTKFCYYNNYSLSQPRYFCKTCRRYWTEGGSLRNIPVGGGSRKTKRQSSSKKISDLPLPQQNPNKIIHESQDLNLGFSNFKNMNELNIPLPNPLSSSPSHSSHNFSALELLTGSRGLSSFMTMPITNDPNNVYSSSSEFSLSEFRPSLNFSLDGLGSNYENFQGVQETNGKELFPFEDLNQQVSDNKNDTNDAEQNTDNQQHGADNSTGYWNGVIGGGSW